jgi:hypothetical protein
VDPGERTARVAGLLYLIVIATGIFGLMYVPSRTVVYGDAVATADRIMRAQTLFRLGILSSLVCEVAFVFLALALYRLLQHVSRASASLMVSLVLAAVPIAFLNEANRVAALLLSSHAGFLSPLAPDRLSALTMLFVHLYDHVGMMAGLLWGLWLLPFGYLVFRSGFIPRILGILLIVAGVSILVDSVTFLVVPELHSAVSDVVGLPSAAGEVVTMLWLLLKGVRSVPGATAPRDPGPETR